MNTEAQLQLREKFHKETGMMWENSDEEPDIDYVEWLEAKVIATQPDVSGSLPSLSDILIKSKEYESGSEMNDRYRRIGFQDGMRTMKTIVELQLRRGNDR